MNSLLTIFNNREMAIITWACILLVWFIFRSDFRKSLNNLFKAFFQDKVLSILSFMSIYIATEVYLFWMIGFWKLYLLKDTLLWIIFVGFSLVLNANKIDKNRKFFSKLLKDNIGIAFLLEFITNLYVFSYWIELLLFPLLFLLVGMSTFTNYHKEYGNMKRVFDAILGIAMSFAIINALYNLLSDINGFISMANIIDLFLPLLLTTAYIPFLYLFALFLSYDRLFFCININHKNNIPLSRFAKRKIIKLCILNIWLLQLFRKTQGLNIYNANNESDIINAINDFKNSRGKLT
jgi:hypothetical protein